MVGRPLEVGPLIKNLKKVNFPTLVAQDIGHLKKKKKNSNKIIIFVFDLFDYTELTVK